MKQLRRIERRLFNSAKDVASGMSYMRRLSRSRSYAKESYRKIRAREGVEPVSPGVGREIRRYAEARFGSSRFAPWLEVYAAHCGQFREGWVPLDFFELHVLPAINPRLIANTSNVKSCTATILGTEYVPDLASYVNGTWYAGGESLKDTQQAKRLVFDVSESVYAKRDYADRGSGVRILTEEDFDSYVESTKGDFVVQRPVHQHYSLSRYYDRAVSTLRVLTFVPNGGSPALVAAYLRLGRGDMRFVSAGGNAIKIPVINEDGEIDAMGLDDEWVVYTAHPDSGVEFKGYHIPSYRQCVSLCESLHNRIPHLALIGWDIAIDGDSSPWILEWNAVTPAFQFIEAMAGPLFKDLDVAPFK